MGYWDSKKQKRYFFPARKGRGRDMGWYQIDCGCCGGLQWGGYEPRECNDCGGGGHIWWHKKSKILAEYPGGKLLGRRDLTKLELKGGYEL